MKTKIYFLTATLVLSLVCFNTMAQKNILFLAEFNPPVGGDSLLMDSLTIWGYTVTGVDPDGFAASDWLSYDALVINESIGSSAANPFMDAGYPIPCLNFEAYTVRTNRWIWITNNDDPLQWVRVPEGADVLTTVITDNTHYITKGYTPYDEIIWSTDVLNDNVSYCAFDISGLVPGAIPLAKSKNPDLAAAPGLHTLWAIPEGTMVPATAGSVPVKRMVFYNTHENVLAPESQTAGLHNIIHRSLQWILKEEPVVAIQSIKSGFSGVKLLNNPVRDNGMISFHLNEAGMVSFSAVNLLGQQILLRSNESFSAGQNEISFSTSELSAGIYLYQLKVNNSIYSGKMYVVK